MLSEIVYKSKNVAILKENMDWDKYYCYWTVEDVYIWVGMDMDFIARVIKKNG